MILASSGGGGGGALASPDSGDSGIPCIEDTLRESVMGWSVKRGEGE